jgi:ABC-type multidrug transport system fused ATPase/permease subunit
LVAGLLDSLQLLMVPTLVPSLELLHGLLTPIREAAWANPDTTLRAETLNFSVEAIGVAFQLVRELRENEMCCTKPGTCFLCVCVFFFFFFCFSQSATLCYSLIILFLFLCSSFFFSPFPTTRVFSVRVAAVVKAIEAVSEAVSKLSTLTLEGLAQAQSVRFEAERARADIEHLSKRLDGVSRYAERRACSSVALSFLVRHLRDFSC